MKIVIIPGVGFHKNTTNHDNFAKKLSQTLHADVDIFYWEHTLPNPTITLPYKDIREWTCEVLLDYQQVVKYADTINVPEADYYIGHSAGSIISLVQKNKKSIIFGSPAILTDIVYNTKEKTQLTIKQLISNKTQVLNIVNKYDILAYPIDFDNVQNYVYKDFFLRPSTYNPFRTHNSYWTNSNVFNKITQQIQTWKQ